MTMDFEICYSRSHSRHAAEIHGYGKSMAISGDTQISGGTILAVQLGIDILLWHNSLKKSFECSHVFNFHYRLRGFIPIGFHIVFVI